MVTNFEENIFNAYYAKSTIHTILVKLRVSETSSRIAVPRTGITAESSIAFIDSASIRTLAFSRRFKSIHIDEIGIYSYVVIDAAVNLGNVALMRS